MRLRLNLPKISFFCAVAGIGAFTLGQSAGCGGGGSTTEASGSGGGSSTGTKMSSTSTSGTGGKASSTSSTSATSSTASTTSTGGSTTSTGGAGGSTTATGGSTTSTGGSAASSTAASSNSSSGPPPVGCGNGTLDSGEECDDGNNFDLDGCDSTCHYETVTRMSTLTIATSAGPAFCVHKGNALGSKALNSLAVSVVLNPALKKDVGDGTVNVLTQFLNLTDLTGQNASGFSIGIVDGSPDPAKGTFPTTNPTDWWFLADPSVVNMGLPTGQLASGTVTKGALAAGPSTVSLTISLGGTLADLTMNNAKVAGTVSGMSAPGDLPPNMKTESGLSVLNGITATGANQGLCGDITVASLKAIPVPAALQKQTPQPTGTYPCTEGYTAANSMLDVLIGGCSITNPLPITAVNKTQPDVPGNGKTVQTLTAGAGKIVTLPPNDTDAYSAFLQFATTREHFSGQSCSAATDCQSGQACTKSVCTPQ